MELPANAKSNGYTVSRLRGVQIGEGGKIGQIYSPHELDTVVADIPGERDYSTS